ncbi:hypothetical protein CPB83DRAFT_804637 [Crepidotus variabilis]|uniref:Uncharacterized protein n=1 Tax=Crepidotus variabilis TaxID=179855 RepID=A0A9P6ERW8_9AGAR|nr:hypothetical protein CPB83DRAFT_804637 [Crepidotus variabilis]
MKSSRKAFFISLLISLLALQATASLHPRQSSGGGQAKTTDKLSTTDKPADSKTDTGTGTGTGTSSTPVQSNTSTTPTSTTTTNAASTPPPDLTSQQPIVTTVISGSDVITTLTNPGASTSAAPSSTSKAAAKSSDDSSGLGTGSIVGLSVAGGVALIGIIAFFVWKFTRKRFSDFDDNEAIKWPDLNNHGNGISDSHPLPVKNTGRAGFDTGSEGDLSRVESTNYSTPDFHAGGPDPYAVPPLPHLNPNQPYQDDPTGGSGYYDPYRGPVPGSIEHGTGQGSEWGHPAEAIPMTQLGMASGRMSPGPHAAYGGPAGMDPSGYDAGRQSPGPYAAYGGRAASPGPQAVYGGRMSPGPQMAYNNGATSPAPRIQ